MQPGLFTSGPFAFKLSVLAQNDIIILADMSAAAATPA